MQGTERGVVHLIHHIGACRREKKCKNAIPPFSLTFLQVKIVRCSKGIPKFPFLEDRQICLQPKETGLEKADGQLLLCCHKILLMGIQSFYQ